MQQIDIFNIYIKIFALMLISFLIGYFSSYFNASKKGSNLYSDLRKKHKQPEATLGENKILTKDHPGLPHKKHTLKSSHEKRFSIEVKDRKIPRADPGLDFKRIGHASLNEKDDLCQIIGIGPNIANRLNQLGIFTYGQISRLNDKDILIVTEMIKFFPDRIKNDRWVNQAEKLLQNKLKNKDKDFKKK